MADQTGNVSQAHDVLVPRTWDRPGLTNIGFEGFIPLATLPTNAAPKLPGIYVVLRKSRSEPIFLARSIAGFFKGADSTVDRVVLEAAWTRGAAVLYIGKATWGSKRDGIRRRLSQYRRHGAGRPVGHRGGEYIWQLEDSADLIVCWMVLDDEIVSDVESAFIDDFEARHGRWPFANRKHERREARRAGLSG